MRPLDAERLQRVDGAGISAQLVLVGADGKLTGLLPITGFRTSSPEAFFVSHRRFGSAAVQRNRSSPRRLMVPSSFDDVSAVIALYRPGPMGENSHTNYADYKNKVKQANVQIGTDRKSTRLNSSHT